MELITGILGENAMYLKPTAAFICGAALLYLVVARTMKRRSVEE